MYSMNLEHNCNYVLQWYFVQSMVSIRKWSFHLSVPYRRLDLECWIEAPNQEGKLIKLKRQQSIRQWTFRTCFDHEPNFIKCPAPQLSYWAIKILKFSIDLSLHMIFVNMLAQRLNLLFVFKWVTGALEQKLPEWLDLGRSSWTLSFAINNKLWVSYFSFDQWECSHDKKLWKSRCPIHDHILDWIFVKERNFIARLYNPQHYYSR